MNTEDLPNALPENVHSFGAEHASTGLSKLRKWIGIASSAAGTAIVELT